MKIRSHNDRAVRVTSVLTSACGSVQLTRYQGTREALVKMRLAEPDWFETGKSGTKRVTDPTLSLEQRYEMKSMARKLWRLTRFHLPGKPPYLPRQQTFVRAQVDYEASLPAAYGSSIESSYANADHCSWTWYTATKEQLICAGLAVPSMFPQHGRSARVRKWSSEEQGHWTADRLPDGRWRICYAHKQFEITPDLKKEIALANLYETLRHHFGDDVEHN